MFCYVKLVLTNSESLSPATLFLVAAFPADDPVRQQMSLEKGIACCGLGSSWMEILC